MKKLMNHFMHAFKNSWHGFQRAWDGQFAFRIEVFVLMIALPLTFYIAKNMIEFILLISSILLLLLVELLNSAIETVIDRIGLEYHKLSGIAKDLSSAAVFITVIYVILVWLCIPLSHMF